MARKRATSIPDEELNSLRDLQAAMQDLVQEYAQLEREEEDLAIAAWMFTKDRPSLFVVKEYPGGKCLVVSARGVAPVAEG